MDPVLTDAARALAIGDPLTALKRVALRDNPPGLALHGIARAQLGDLAAGRELLARAARGFGPRDAVARARCVVARSEIALATRELGRDGRDRALDAAIDALAAHGDHRNALHGRLIALRRLLLLGRVELAARARDGLARLLAGTGAPPALVAIAELAAAEIAVRRIEPREARAALGRAREAARRARIGALVAEVDAALAALDAPAARRIAAGEARALTLDDVAAVLAGPGAIVDACRRAVRDGRRVVSLARRPVLFALARALGEAWPADAPREALIAAAFEVRRANETHRARLRVELGRLRRELRGIAEIRATPGGFALAPRAGGVVVLAPPIDGHGAALLALLADGEAWSTSALALALGQSQRTVQRTLSELEARGRVQSRGGARARRWLAPPGPGFAPAMLLPAALPIG